MTKIFKQHDIIVWHAHTGDMMCRVVHVYDAEPKTLLLTDNLDDEVGLGKCFHAPQQDCTFVREGQDVTASQRGKYRTKHGALPQNLIKTTPIREDV